jgi:hypothetical protein
MEDRVGAHMDDALAFVPSGANLPEAVRGDLTGDGIQYQLLVIDQPTPEGWCPASTDRTGCCCCCAVMGAGAGSWPRATTSWCRVPPGGLAGDPFAYAMVEKGTFSVITNGGSRERWSSTYRFRYAPADKACWVDGVRRKVVDIETEATNIGITRRRSWAGCGSRTSTRPVVAEVSLP